MVLRLVDLEKDAPLEDDFQEVVSRIAHETYRLSPSIMPEQPWWQNLESTFWQRPEGFELELRDQLMVNGTAAMDYGLRTFAATAVATLAMPLGFHPAKLTRDLREADLYKEMADTHDPTVFFQEPPRGVRVRTGKPSWPYYKPDDGVCESLSFTSPFKPAHPKQRKDYLKHKTNRIAHARYWRHHEGPRPTIIAIHGFGADPYWLNEWFFQLPWFYEMGCDVLLFTLPFHGARQPTISPFSGHGFFSGGIGRINEAFGQAVYDFRILMNYLEDVRGVEKVGVTGISLGGHTTALLAAVEKRLEFAIPNVPVVTLPDLILEWEPIGTLVRSALFGMQRSIKELRHIMAPSCPLTYKPVLPRERLMIIGGVGDRLAPPKHSRLLWDHWGRCRIHWFPGNHVIHLDKGEYMRYTKSFLNKINFIETSD